jgi:hypothetical protein
MARVKRCLRMPSIDVSFRDSATSAAGRAFSRLRAYGHLWPDKDESTKAVIDALVDSKFRDLADSVRTEGGAP